MLGVLPVLVLGLMVIFIAQTIVRDSLLKEIKDALQSAATSTFAAYDQNSGDYIKTENGEIWKGSYNISKSESLVDSIKEKTGLEVTFFYGKDRIMTSAKDKNGDRILGSPAGETIQKEVLEKGKEYFSDSVSIPVGMIFVGANKAQKDSAINKIINTVILVVLIVMLLCIAVAAVFAFNFSGALKKGINMVQSVSSGNLKNEMDTKLIKRQDELGDLSKAISSLQEEMIKSIANIAGNAEAVLMASGELGETARETTTSMRQVEGAIDSIMQSAATQAEISDKAAKNVHSMGEKIERTTEEMEQMQQNADAMSCAEKQNVETIRELQKIDKQNEYFILVSPGDDICLQESANMHIVTVNWPSYPLWEQIGLPLALRKIKPDLLHCTSNTAPVYGNIPLVLTLHDIIFLEKKQGKNQSMYQRLGRFYRRIIVPQILTRCKRIITVSHFECNRISHFLHIDRQLLVAVHNGYSQHFIPIRNAQATTARYIKKHPYLFFLGNTDPKKNTARVLQAYGIYLKKSRQPLPLLIADLKEEIIDEYLNRQGLQEIKKMLYHPGYIPNTELPAVYSGASVFIYTSLRESFGIPILEAMACGTPVITSTTSAMPEITGPEGILVNPFEPEEIASALLHLEENAEFYESQTAYGLERVRQFSWENTAREILKIYKEILA